MGQGTADDLRLLVDLLGHEVPVIALVDQQRARLAFLSGPADRLVGLVEKFGAAAVQDHPVAFLQIGDLVGERRQGQSVRAEEHLAFAEADRQRRAASRPDQQIVAPVEQEGERESTAQAGQSGRNGLARRLAGFEFIGHQMGHDLGVGFGREIVALGDEFVPQFAEVLDDAVMHDGQALAGVGMRIVLARPAMRGPARMADADRTAQGLFRQAQREVTQLSRRAPPGQHAIFERGDAGRIVAAIFQSLQGIDDLVRHRTGAKNAYNAAHVCSRFWPTGPIYPTDRSNRS